MTAHTACTYVRNSVRLSARVYMFDCVYVYLYDVRVRVRVRTSVVCAYVFVSLRSSVPVCGTVYRYENHTRYTLHTYTDLYA